MPDNKAGRPYVKGPDPINIGSINPVTTGFPGLSKGRALSQEEMIQMYDKQVDPNLIRAGKTYLSDVAGDLTGRYDTVIYGANNEDAWGQQQSVLSKGVNGILKGTNLAATTVLGGFATLGGAVSSIITGRLADIWDNPGMQAIDEWNEKVDQEYLPNYYTDTEKNAEWYSTDNWMTANFLFDKVIKNSGFAVGAVISGNMAAGAFRVAGTAIGEAAASRALLMESSQAFKSFAPLLKNTSRAFSAGKNAEAAAILEKKISSSELGISNNSNEYVTKRDLENVLLPNLETMLKNHKKEILSNITKLSMVSPEPHLSRQNSILSPNIEMDVKGEPRDEEKGK